MALRKSSDRTRALNPAAEQRYTAPFDFNRNVLLEVHQRLNSVSGSIVLSYKNGPERAEAGRWRDELMALSSMIDAQLRR